MTELQSVNGASANQQPDFVTALARGLKVIRAFGTDDTPATLAEIARRVGLARATVRRSLITLAALGYVETDGRLFALTPKILSLGQCYLTSIPLARSACACLQNISQTLNETSGTGVLDGDEVVLLARVPVRDSINRPQLLGNRIPAYCTTTGHVLLASQPDEAIREYLARLQPEPLTPRTETDVEKIGAAIFAARERGYAILEEQTEIGVRAISVPIENTRRCVVAALHVIAPMNRASAEEMTGRFLPLMREKAGELGLALS